ncbi:hypothetical protein HYY73_00590 [Candidatus Woesearchaeota archaeon]|nr:hypothetical protein [Candidatus Woesearchaeota archaeon]
MVDAKLLEVRKAVKRRKPNFQIQNSNDPKKRWPGRWKRPKGLQSKMRERRKGNPRYIEPGYGSPAALRGATTEGLFPVIVNNVSGLGNVNGDSGVVVSSTTGMRKKTGIVRAAVEQKLKLLNVDAAKFIKGVEESIGSRKKRRHELLQKRKFRAESKKPQPAEATAATSATAVKSDVKPAKDDIESKVDDEERKKAEKAEKDRILTKRSD